MYSSGKYRITKFFGIWIVDHPLGNGEVFFSNPRFLRFRHAVRFIKDCLAVAPPDASNAQWKIGQKLRDIQRDHWESEVNRTQREAERLLT